VLGPGVFQHAAFEEDGGAYNQADAAGFIKLNALRMRIAANKGRSLF
jgi:argininosuccinate synthase